MPIGYLAEGLYRVHKYAVIELDLAKEQKAAIDDLGLINKLGVLITGKAYKANRCLAYCEVTLLRSLIISPEHMGQLHEEALEQWKAYSVPMEWALELPSDDRQIA